VPAVSRRAEGQEVFALRLSLVLVILFAAGASLVAMWSDSETMTLESMSAVADIVVAGLAVFVARKVNAPANRRFQFGYAKYEPLMTTVEGILVAGVCASALFYSVRDILHPEPVEDAHFVVIYSAASFAISVTFGLWMRNVGKRAASPLVQTDAELWIVEGWLALGVCAAFVAGIVLGRLGHVQASAYVDPLVCIALSGLFLKKPYAILRDSIADLVDANPYADVANLVEECAKSVAERLHLKGVERVRVRRAGRRLFATVSFFENAAASLEHIDRVRQAVIDELARLGVDVDVVVACRPMPSPRGAVGAGTAGAPTRADS
jgi:cation diffusion facilitator family transporter